MRDSVREVERVAAAEGIAADVKRGGTVVLARSAPQLERARAEAAESLEYGLDVALLDEAAARGRLAATGVLGATYTPHCAAVQPAKLVRGLARVVASRGAALYEGTTATAIEPHLVRTDRGDVRAEFVVRATEGYTAQLPGLRRVLAPVYSLIVATEPLTDAVWDEIGLRERETFSDHRHLIIYGQRSADNRMVFGGRGAPYHAGSRIRPEYDRVPRVFAELERTLHELFPILRGTAITHRWGGPLGIARDWHASVGLDRATGLAWAGGYVGDGVSTTNLAGRTLADLITGTSTERTALPWVGHRSRRWEPEPLRWAGANLGLRAMTWADALERRTGRPSRVAAAVNDMMGR
jgi:glycine/D-amino acid oxidase-like deaminating enzyme